MHVKFRDRVKLPYLDHIGPEIERQGLGAWSDLAHDVPGVRISRMFVATSLRGLKRLSKEATARKPDYHPPNFRTWFVIDVPDRATARKVADRLRRWPSVDHAYPAPVISLAQPPVVPTDGEGFTQGHLAPARDGIDAPYAWGCRGGRGESVSLADVEAGWVLDHAELRTRPIATDEADGTTAPNGTQRQHGTRVMGVVCAEINGLLGMGVVPELAGVHAVSTLDRELADALTRAGNLTQPGDVLLIEAQIDEHDAAGRTIHLPVEMAAAHREVIETLSLSRVVIEPAGNGVDDIQGIDLDNGIAALGLSGYEALTSASPDDSGAILVAGASQYTSHAPTASTNYGTRVDCFAWGQSVRTCDAPEGNAGPQSLASTDDFGGTSSAAAIIAGAAAAVQGMQRASGGAVLNSGEMRAILTNAALSTAPTMEAYIDQIGRMPDLKKIALDHFQVAPDVFIRDLTYDLGKPLGSFQGLSPDVVILTEELDDPQERLGPAGPGEGLLRDQVEIRPGRDHFIYLRLHNRGTGPAEDLRVRLFWAPAGPAIWPAAGTPRFVGETVVGFVPARDEPTLALIHWNAPDVPEEAAGCVLVAVLGNQTDQDLATLGDPVTGWSRLATSNDLAARNLHFVSFPARARPRTIRLPFRLFGRPQEAQETTLHVDTHLPAGSTARLIAPEPTLQRALQPRSRQDFGPTQLAAGAELGLEVEVTVPALASLGALDMVVATERRLGREAGRIVWLLR